MAYICFSHPKTPLFQVVPKFVDYREKKNRNRCVGLNCNFTHFSYRICSIMDDFDIHFRRKCIYEKISSSSPTSLGTCGNDGFLDGEGEMQLFTI